MIHLSIIATEWRGFSFTQAEMNVRGWLRRICQSPALEKQKQPDLWTGCFVCCLSNKSIVYDKRLVDYLVEEHRRKNIRRHRQALRFYKDCTAQ